MDAYGCFGALSCAFHRAQVIKAAAIRRDRERRAKRRGRELGRLRLFKAVDATAAGKEERNSVVIVRGTLNAGNNGRADGDQADESAKSK